MYQGELDVSLDFMTHMCDYCGANRIISKHAKELTMVRWRLPKSGWVMMLQRKGWEQGVVE
ncbi:hypothetical protein L195_g041642 [Trifolium pratense]|uniref:Uncharacterized protein n=1 Tax=Trifolium pratense TaxID=57577 RepID=A0A2K3M458_TRIPR|nr:hypothetical protein L195_g041642 [Trifolium pratense]